MCPCGGLLKVWTFWIKSARGRAKWGVDPEVDCPVEIEIRRCEACGRNEWVVLTKVANCKK